MTTNQTWTRPQTTVVLAMSADGKISDVARSPANFGSANDKAHLENQVAQADGILFGAGTLRSGGTAMRVVNPELLKQRESLGKPAQPVQIVCSRTSKIDPQLGFFRQPIPRWLLTTSAGAQDWEGRPEFERILVTETSAGEINWNEAFQQMAQLGLKQLSILGGGELVASLLEADLIDEFWLTVCPLILGGATAPTPVEGAGFLSDQGKRLELLSAQTMEQEVFLHYRLQR
ncbi:MAG: dihydrofolate reductase family protein [Aphanothece sp. CMT-3BRIN-NPC111]|nr:dihydrofolate reductase family protein [Aphanothece sp. CMT-3BRIN-NPC111]